MPGEFPLNKPAAGLLYLLLGVWGRSGFDGMSEALAARRGWSVGLLKKPPKTNKCRLQRARIGRLIDGHVKSLMSVRGGGET